MTDVHKKLPGPWALAKEAWVLFLDRFWSLFKVFGLNTILVIGALLLGAIAVSLFFFGSGNQIYVLFGIILGIIVFVAFVYISIWMQASYLLALSGNKDTIRIKEVLKQARPFILPLFLTSLLTTFLSIGGIFLFLIPGILLSIWFSFQQYIVVYENKSNFLALHTSREYFRGRFFPIVWRMIAVYIPVIILGIFFSPPQQGEPTAGNGIFQLISFVAQPFYLVYGVVLYQHLAKTTNQKVTSVPTKSRNQYLLISGAGYVLLILFVLFILPR